MCAESTGVPALRPVSGRGGGMVPLPISERRGERSVVCWFTPQVPGQVEARAQNSPLTSLMGARDPSA